jgi:autotransporter-associated beta strand protein
VAITKTGKGTQLITGSATHTGAITVNGGTLMLETVAVEMGIRIGRQPK